MKTELCDVRSGNISNFSKPMCGNAELLTGTLRNNWSYTGHVVSDCSAVGNIYDPAGYTDDLPSASAMALKAGTDMNCGPAYAASMQQAVDEKLVAEEDFFPQMSQLNELPSIV